MKQFYVYILCDDSFGYLYVGVTSNLSQRIYQHRAGLIEGLTKKRDIKRLVFFEIYDDPENAIQREKQLKKWNRQWKFNLIERKNPHWKDLYSQL